MSEFITNQNKPQVPKGYYDQYGVKIPVDFAKRAAGVVNFIESTEIAQKLRSVTHGNDCDRIDRLQHQFMVASQNGLSGDSMIPLSEADVAEVGTKYENCADLKGFAPEAREAAEEVIREMTLRLRQMKGQALPLPVKLQSNQEANSIGGLTNIGAEKGAKDGLG